MKNAVLGTLAIIIIILVSLTIVTGNNRSIRKTELESNLDQALKRSMEILIVDQKYNIDKMNSEEFVSDVVQDILSGTTSDSDFKVDIKNMELKKGILDVQVTETYQQVLGTGTVSARKQIVLDDWENDENVYYTVSFKIDDTIVKQWNVHAGDSLSKNFLPQSISDKEGLTLKGWKLVSPTGNDRLYTELNIQDIMVTQELIFQAVYA